MIARGCYEMTAVNGDSCVSLDLFTYCVHTAFSELRVYLRKRHQPKKAILWFDVPDLKSQKW